MLGLPQDCEHSACTLGAALPCLPPLAPPSRGLALLSHPSSMQSKTLQFCFFLNRVTQAQPLHTALAQPGAVLLTGTWGFLHCCTHSRGRKPHTRTTAAGHTWALERPLLTLWAAGCRGSWGMSTGATLACPRPLLPADGHRFHLPCFPKPLRTGGQWPAGAGQGPQPERLLHHWRTVTLGKALFPSGCCFSSHIKQKPGPDW